jgi:apolipoprotein D and lipocalin family protein
MNRSRVRKTESTAPIAAAPSSFARFPSSGGRGIWPAILMVGFVFAACAASRNPPIRTVPHVDLQRFMGDWHVVANIPTFVEKGAHGAVESYRLDADGTVATTFTFREGSCDGERKRYRPRGFVLDRETNSVWGMQFIWPFKGDFRIIYLNDDYTQTVIGREKRDYVWVMARQPTIPEGDYQRILELLTREGYDTSEIQTVPQCWDDGLRDRGEPQAFHHEQATSSTGIG